MNLSRILFTGTIAGLVMGIALFLTGAIAAFFVYGPQMAPEGKFEPSQMNPAYFIWTKLLIGWFFGLLFTLIYVKIHALLPLKGFSRALMFALSLWFVLSVWGISHPLVYETIATRNQLFWNVYTLGGFLGYGAALGFLVRKIDQPKEAASV
jgi:hypothetical protein